MGCRKKVSDALSVRRYDCLYLALAVHLGGRMVTADERLVNSLAGTPWAASALKIQVDTCQVRTHVP
jgi:hypothetical protein